MIAVGERALVSTIALTLLKSAADLDFDLGSSFHGNKQIFGNGSSKLCFAMGKRALLTARAGAISPVLA